MKKKLPLPALVICLLALISPKSLNAQLPYTDAQFDIRVEKDISFGSALNFAGAEEELLLDLYKPVGDDNCRRPLIVMVHGGAFIAGAKTDNDVVQICREMASRGYVAASVGYRLGMHPIKDYTPYFFCNDNLNPVGVDKCIYVADSMEFYRATYRAVQDVKGAIRFLKNRNELDSTDVGCVFVGGTSAGAIVSLYVGSMDQASEQIPFTTLQADAPAPDGDLQNCVPAPRDRKRPDLGLVEGALHLGGYDAGVRGVASFMGGVFDQSLLSGAGVPAVYFYHRTDDLIVACERRRLFSVYQYCLNPLNLCQPLSTQPWMYGSCALKSYLENLGNAAPPFFDDIVDQGQPGSGDCLDDPPGHSIAGLTLRCQNLSNFFAEEIQKAGNTPSSVCTSADFEEAAPPSKLVVYPNPTKEKAIWIDCPTCSEGGATLRLFDLAGQRLAMKNSGSFPLNWDLENSGIARGMYFIQMTTGHSSATAKVIFE